MIKNYTGKNLDELLATVAHEKDVLISELVYKVTEEKNGFLGLGQSVSADIYCFVDVMNFIRDYLADFFQLIEHPVDIEVEYDNDQYLVNIDSDNNAVIIGRNGQSLQAINVLIRNVTNQVFHNRFYIKVDVNGYKKGRYQKVANLARRVAKNVQQSKIDAALDPMPNDERKVVHQTLSNMKNIVTESEGQGKFRHIVIKYNKSQDQ